MPPKPRDFASQPPRQQPKKQDETNPKDRAPGGARTAVDVVTPAMGPKASGFIGTGTQGVAAQKPFKVGGG